MFKNIFMAAWLALASLAAINATAATSITALATPSNMVAPASVTLSINVIADPDPVTISQVEYFNGTTSLGVSVTAPFSLELSNVTAGAYGIVAKATVVAPENLILLSEPVALTVSSATPNGNVYYIHTDQLNTPRAISDQSSASVWKWDSDPFASTPPNESPVNPTLFSFSLRFPGQVSDRETNLYYNYFRDYDPNLGRYLESDPIGLAGGMNSYLYAEAAPTSTIDIWGLAPGDPYRTVDAAGTQAIRDINPRSIREGVEYAGRIYKMPNGSFSYTTPNKGTKAKSDFGQCPPGTTNAGQYHTHGSYSPAYHNEVFSNSDMEWAARERVPSYLGTPNGVIGRFTPIPGGKSRDGTAIAIGQGAK